MAHSSYQPIQMKSIMIYTLGLYPVLVKEWYVLLVRLSFNDDFKCCVVSCLALIIAMIFWKGPAVPYAISGRDRNLESYVLSSIYSL